MSSWWELLLGGGYLEDHPRTCKCLENQVYEKNGALTKVTGLDFRASKVTVVGFDGF